MALKMQGEEKEGWGLTDPPLVLLIHHIPRTQERHHHGIIDSTILVCVCAK